MKLLKIYSILYLLSLTSIFAQDRSDWFDEAGVYRNWLHFSDAVNFDNTIHNNGIPAWGEWVRIGEEDRIRQNVEYHFGRQRVRRVVDQPFVR